MTKVKFFLEDAVENVKNWFEDIKPSDIVLIGIFAILAEVVSIFAISSLPLIMPDWVKYLISLIISIYIILKGTSTAVKINRNEKEIENLKNRLYLCEDRNSKAYGGLTIRLNDLRDYVESQEKELKSK